MSLFDRIANLTKATLHEVLNKLEDPILMTGQYLRNLEEELEQAKAELFSARASTKMRQHQQEEARQRAAEHEQHALAAMKSSDEQTARYHLEAKLLAEGQAERYATDEQAALQRATELEQHLETAKEELARLKKKREELIERARKVTEHKATDEPGVHHGIPTGRAAKGFERMEDKITSWEASAAPHSSTSYSHTSNSLRIDEELERLQSKLDHKHTSS